MARKTPELKLNEEEPLVLSRDFNLFYQPETEPLPQGTETFLKSLDAFISGAGSSMVIASEVKQSKAESAKAVEDYANLQTKFRKAIKEGKIKKEANPYYLKKYQLLSLNSYASEFSDVLLKAYTDNNVATDITEGAFDSFYADQLKAFITKKNLGQFEPMVLEKGFFQETSAYRDQLEATHKSNLMTNFKDNFDDKLKARVIGVILKYKNADKSSLTGDGTPVNIYELIAQDLQKEIQSIIEVTDDGRATIDTVFDGLKLYVEQTDDYEFAKTIIDNVPELLVGGTGKVSEIGRIKAEKNELSRLLFDKANEALNNKNNFEKNLLVSQSITTSKWIAEKKKAEPDFNVINWKNEEGRTEGEIRGAELYIKQERFDGGNSDNDFALKEIEKLLEEEKFIEASEIVMQYFEDGEIRRSTMKDYIDIRIPNAFDLKDNIYFQIPVIKDQIISFEKTIASGKGKDIQSAVAAKAYVKHKLNLWLKDTETNKELINKYENNSSLKIDDFEKEYIKIINQLKTIPSMTKLFGEGEIFLSGGGTVIENIDKKIEKSKTTDEAAQKLVDFKDTNISDEEFEKKYGETRAEYQKGRKS